MFFPAYRWFLRTRSHVLTNFYKLCERTRYWHVTCMHMYMYVYMINTCMYSGRIDRKIEFPLPDEKTRRRIFQIHTKKMTLAEDLDLEEYITAKDDLSGADIKVGTDAILCCNDKRVDVWNIQCIYTGVHKPHFAGLMNS